MKIIEFGENQREEWNNLVIRSSGSFLQSFEWSKFQESLNRKVGMFSNREFRVLIIQHKLPFGRSYLYCPRGPVFENNRRANLQDIISQLKEVRPPEIKSAVFLRIDPEWEDNDENRKILADAGFRKSSKEIQPKNTLILEITKSEEELLARMHPKTRYNIRVAERHGIKILNSKLEILNKFQASNYKFQNYFDEFWRLMRETAQRNTFRPHLKEYYQKMLEAFRPTADSRQPTAKLFLAECKNEIIAANIIVFFGRRATYLHGASDYKHRNLMAPYLLQWEQIKEAKKMGCVEYDFWGVDAKRWPGITRFKKGFGGKEIQYIGAWDFVFNENRYRGYNLFAQMRKTLSKYPVFFKFKG